MTSNLRTSPSPVPLLKAADAVALAREWVEGQASPTPGFCGAHLKGSLLKTSASTPWQTHGDVDVNVLLEGSSVSHRFSDVVYRGVLIDCTWIDVAYYDSVEDVLTNVALAPNLAIPEAILTDPTGRLKPLAKQVAERYGEKRWVQARCMRCREVAAVSRKALVEGSLLDAGTALWKLVGAIGAQLAQAHLCSPTHRRSLVVTGELLRQGGHDEMHEELLDLAGFSAVTSGEARRLVDECEALFDRALARLDAGGDLPTGSRFRPQARDYALVGSRSMIDAGYPREAMYWIVAQLSLVLGALLHLEPRDQRSKLRSRLLEIVASQGLVTDADRCLRIELATDLCQRFDDLVDHLLQTTFG